MANYLGDFAATPVDTADNPDIDEAVGIGAPRADDDWATAFTKGLQSSLYRNSPQGRELTAAYAKQKLANQLELQLQERKLQLAQKYEPYKQFTVTPYGSVLGIGQNGVKELYSDPAMKSAYTAHQTAQQKEDEFKSSPEYLQAQMAELKAKPEETAARIKELNSRSDYYSGAASEAARARAEAARNPQVKPKYTSYKEALEDAAMEMGVNIKDDYFQRKLMRQDPQAITTMNKVASRAKELFNQQSQSAGGMASPQASPPDISGLMSPLDVD